MGMIDNMYVFNYLINKQLRKGKKLVVIFVDLKATFDTVDRSRIVRDNEGERDKREINWKSKGSFEMRSRMMIGRQKTEKKFLDGNEG